MGLKRTPIAAHIGGPISDTRVVGAIRQARDRLTTTEKEIGRAGIADWPTAGILGEFEQAAALAERNDIVDRLRLRVDFELISKCKRCVAAYRAARDAQHVRSGARFAQARRSRGQ